MQLAYKRSDMSNIGKSSKYGGKTMSISTESTEPSTIIMFKPRYSTYVLLVCSIIMIISSNSSMRVFGCICLAVSFIVIKAIRNTIVARIYEDRIVLIQNGSEDETLFNTVTEWNTEGNKIYIKRNDETTSSVETFDASKAHNTLKKYIGDKETFSVMKKAVSKQKK